MVGASPRVWFAAAWYITHQKQGVSALGLQRVLGLNSYQSAWAMLHRFRRAMVHPDRDLLCGTNRGRCGLFGTEPQRYEEPKASRLKTPQPQPFGSFRRCR